MLLWRCLFTHRASGRVVTKGRSHTQLLAGPSPPRHSLPPFSISFAERTDDVALPHSIAAADALLRHTTGRLFRPPPAIDEETMTAELNELQTATATPQLKPKRTTRHSTCRDPMCKETTRQQPKHQTEETKDANQRRQPAWTATASGVR